MLLGIAAAYLAGTRRLLRFERRWSPGRTACYVTGVAVTELALASPLATEARSLFSVRALQLMLLIDVAPTLLALGAPISLLLEAAPGRPRRLAQRALASRSARFVTHPAVALIVVLVSAYGYFLTPLYSSSLRHPVLLDAVEAEFLLAGCLYWSLAIGTDRLPTTLSEPLRLIYLGVTIPPGAFLGIDLLNAVRPISSIDSLAETHIGGAVLWGFADLYTLAALAVVFIRWMQCEDRRELASHEIGLDAVAEAERIVAAAASSLVEPGDSSDDPGRP